MSTDEQDAALLRIVKQRSEAKRRLTLLENDLRTAGAFLQEFGGSLKHLSAHGDYSQIEKLASQAPGICDLARIREMISEYAGCDHTIKDLDGKAKALGID